VSEDPARRTIRSFVRREGRITAAQRTALEQLWPRYGIEPAQLRAGSAPLFGRAAPLVVEIGIGDGTALVVNALAHPECDLVGIEVYRPGLGAALRALEERQLDNVRLVQADARAVLEQDLPVASIDLLLIFFPDPWPKKRHHKRRLVQPAFLELVRERLKPGGRVYLATDWADYARHAAEALAGVAGLVPVDPDLVRNWRPLTKFAARGRRAGHGEYEVVAERGPRDPRPSAIHRPGAP